MKESKILLFYNYFGSSNIYLTLKSKDDYHIDLYTDYGEKITTVLSADELNEVTRYLKENYYEDRDKYDKIPYTKNRFNNESTNEEANVSNKNWFNVDWKDYVKKIKEIAAPEEWSNSTYPNDGILVNYMAHTTNNLKKNKKIIETSEYAVLNTGLFTEFDEPIYAHQNKNGTVIFGTAYKMSEFGIDDLPLRADYFSDPSLLLFDWNYDIRVQFSHILKDKDNKDRLPEELSDNNNIQVLLRGAIETAKRKVAANYKLAIPQYFDDKIQLLLPLYLLNNEKPELVLVLTKKNNYYMGHTCITLDMAYNNARLIAKPESNWLTAN